MQRPVIRPKPDEWVHWRKAVQAKDYSLFHQLHFITILLGSLQNDVVECALYCDLVCLLLLLHKTKQNGADGFVDSME